MSVNGLSQIRYYKENDPRNTPFPTRESYSKPFDFSVYAKIEYMMVYALPGTKFYIEVAGGEVNTNPDTGSPLGFVVGETGLYTVDLRKLDNIDPVWITKFYVDSKSMDIIESNPMGHLIVILAHKYIPPV